MGMRPRIGGCTGVNLVRDGTAERPVHVVESVNNKVDMRSNFPEKKCCSIGPELGRLGLGGKI